MILPSTHTLLQIGTTCITALNYDKRKVYKIGLPQLILGWGYTGGKLAVHIAKKIVIYNFRRKRVLEGETMFRKKNIKK